MAVTPVLLMHCDGSNASTTFTDSSMSNHSFTAYGTGSASISNSYVKFGTGSLFINAGGIKTPKTSDFDFANQNFTVEFYYLATGPDFYPIGSYASVTNGYSWFIIKETAYVWKFYYATNVNGPLLSLSFSTSESYGDRIRHCAFVRNGSSLTCYIDGIALSTQNIGTTTIANAAAPLTIGSIPTTIAATAHAATSIVRLDEIRIVKGTAVYTSNFTPGGPFTPGDRFTVALQYHNGTDYTPLVNSTALNDVGSNIMPGSKTVYWHNPKLDRGIIEGTNNQTVQITAEPDVNNTDSYTLTVNSANQLTTAETTASIGDVKVTYTIA